MRDAEFREWLGRRSYHGRPITPKGINNRVRKAPRIERALKELGFSEQALDEVHVNGHWPDLVEAVRRVAADWRSNMAAARKMAPQAPDPTRQLTNLINVARQYGHFANGKDPNYDVDADVPDGDEIDEAALDALRDRFLARFPDFESGGGFAGRSSYHAEEDDYKRALISKVQTLLSGEPQPRELGIGLLALLLDDNSMNLVGDFRRKNHLIEVRDRSGGAFEEAVGELALSDAEPPQAAAAFVEQAWPLVFEGSEQSKPYSDIRVLATLPQALARPAKAISVVTRRFDNLSQALLDRPIFGGDVLTTAEYKAALELSRDLLAAMEEWGWHPRDLWDVQGFVWVTCKEKLEMVDAGNGEALGQSDRIRQYALEHYIRPARARGDRSVSIRVGELHDALKLKQAHPNVCSSLRGQKFLALAEVPAPTYSGPDTSSSTILIFQLGKAIAGPASLALEPLNLILYGPPGTGKTYATAAEAVKLCDGLANDDPLLNDPTRRQELMGRYNELVEARRIDFVTFHQSYSYEEFVEGLRPVQTGPEIDEAEPSSAGFSLRPEEGLFRRISQRAAASRGGGGQFDIGGRRLFKLSIGEAANPEDDYLFEEAIAQGYALLGYGDIDWSDARFEDRNAIIAACHDYDREHPDEEQRAPTPQAGRVQCPMIFRNWVKPGDLIVVSKGNLKFRAIGEVTGTYEYAPRPTGVYSHRRSVNWLWVDRAGAPVDDILIGKNFSQRAIYVLERSELSVPALEGYINSQLPGAGQTGPEPFVLVIDEINRGNISRIFGELITLIEPDKRAGMTNALEVRLPYSKTSFAVPANLHLVGTMNTADRSIALLDTALRRRFVFRELAPDPSLLPEDVEGVPLRDVLEAINDRIEYLIDREHRIGHAFFMGEGGGDRQAIDRTMRDKVIPLLQEYFFEDWSRVAAVLGERPERGGAFLDGRKLRDPTGNDGQDRVSWSVRAQFAPDAYQRLIRKAPLDPAEELPA